MEYNRTYSKNFGIFLMVLAFGIIAFFSDRIGDIQLWGLDSQAYPVFAVLLAFSFVFTGAIGLAFYRGVFLMSEHVIKPKGVKELTADTESA